ncbi:glycosyltransferase family 4 protein [Thermococcus sp. 9N3]|uniref:glycosyltransferase family 4 protein n=1 Tax=Thermococcus sp. 9N3 TaxID=163002 RepID=UPI0014312BCD|nr:glycosyltransferase family 4 protein [Thermococcus sp. 9N3]NJE49568.1 glycosyltransferase family 1 protein [Thermococcus sp. 9N3]
MESLRIAFVYDVIYPWVKGGVEKRIYELAVRLARFHEVHVYGYKHWEGKDEIERDGIHYHGTVRVGNLYSGGRRSILPPLLHSLSLVSRLKGERFDVIDCQASPYLPAYSLRVLKEENVFITWHEFWGDYWLDYLGWAGLIGRATERGLFSFERHISVSQKTRLDLLNAGLRKPVYLVPNGIDIALIRSVKPSSLESDFLFVGRLIPEKGVDFFLRSLALLRREFPDFRAVIAGDGPERRKLESLARELGIGDNVTFTGFLKDYRDVIALMKASRVFAFPSRREGFGIVVIEAMASGLPVVTVNHNMNASKNLIVEGKNGFISAINEKDFAEKILIALEKSRKMRSTAINIATKYEWERIVKKLERYYQGF